MDDNLLQELPPDARSAVMGLIGTAFAELKKVDENMVSPTKGIQGVKTDIKKLIQEASTIGSVPPPAPTAPQPPTFIPQNPIPNVQPPPAVLPEPTVVYHTGPSEDPDQLQFDFFRKITPEDINKNLSDINYSLNRVLDKLNKVLKILTDGNKDTQ